MAGRELPVGWVEVPIGDLCELRNGRAFKPAEWTDEGIPIVRIQNLNNWQAKFNHYQGEVDANHLLGGGELLFAWSGTPGTSFGAHIWAGGKAALNQHIFRVDFDEVSLRKDFFRYAINQKLNDLIDIAHGGVGLRHVTKGKFEQTEVCLPPLNEQRRIAVKLDITIAAVEACRQRLDGVAAILKRFRQAVLAAATSGELTREWREERGGTIDSWSKKIIADVSDQVFDGPFGSNLKSDDYTAQGARVVRLENISHLRFIEEKRTYVSREKFALLQKHVLFEDDILFSSFVDEEVRTCLLPAELSGGSINKADCFCIRANRDICLPGFVVSVLSCRSTFESFDGLVHGATRPRINLKQLKSIAINFPPIGEQLEILKRQDDLFSLADQLEARLATARKIVDRLTPALLARAFRGELVPQDPSDEPASVLLERIRAARQADAAAGKPSRRGRKKAATNPDQFTMEAAPVSADFLAGLLRECGALSERALWAVSELEPERFQQQLYRELESGTAREVQDNGQVLLEAVG
jgi:type I restriction enzyme S subunit